MKEVDQAHYADSKIFDDIGKYLVLFQTLESYLDRMIVLAIGHDRYHIGLAVVAKLSNRAKIDILNASVLGSGVKVIAEKSQSEWLGKFRKFIKACESEGEIRNSLAHNNFLFEFVKIGGPVINSRRSINRNGLQIRSQEVTETTMKVSLQKISRLCVDAGFMHVQLVHWSDHFDQKTNDANIKNKDVALD